MIESIIGILGFLILVAAAIFCLYQIIIPFTCQFTLSQKDIDELDETPLMIRGNHRYSFRSGEWAEVIAVKMITPEGSDPRACFECLYEDGFIDYIPVSDNKNYEFNL